MYLMIIAVEGINGSGKTTLIKKLKHTLNNCNPITIHHPNNNSFEGEKALDYFGENNNLEGGLWALEDINRSYAIARQHPKNCYIWSRCQMSALVYNGNFHRDFTALKNKIFRDRSYPDCLIYLDIPPETCWERVMNRNRAKDIDLTLEKLKKDYFRYQEIKKIFKTLHQENKIEYYFEYKLNNE
jgi:thymidylate kinase